MATTLYVHLDRITTATMVTGVAIYSVAASLPIIGILIDLF